MDVPAKGEKTVAKGPTLKTTNKIRAIRAASHSGSALRTITSIAAIKIPMKYMASLLSSGGGVILHIYIPMAIQTMILIMDCLEISIQGFFSGETVFGAFSAETSLCVI